MAGYGAGCPARARAGLDDEVGQIRSLDRRLVAYQRIADDWFAASHTTQSGYRYVLGLTAKGRAAIVQVLITKPAGERLSESDKQLIEDIACSVNFAGSALPCSGKRQ
jgi:hypothetical protein